MVTIDFAFGTWFAFKKNPKLSRVYKGLKLSWPYCPFCPFCPFSSPENQPESPATPRHTSEAKASEASAVFPMSMAWWLFSCFPQHLYNMYNINQLFNTYQYIFSFLGPLSQRDPTLPSKALLKPLTGIWNHSQCILGIKMWSAWKVTYLLYIFFIYLVVPSNQAKWHSGLPSASWYLPNPKFTGTVA